MSGTLTKEPRTVIADDLGAGGFNRRLSDKILSAFNHAYAIGAVEIAERLKAVLIENERQSGHGDSDRRGDNPLGQAEHWVGFVEARNSYKKISQVPDADPTRVAEALDDMKAAYQRWSET